MSRKGAKFSINMAGLASGAGAILFLLLSIFLSSWLYNPPGRNFYPYPRYWGLLSVTGRVTQTHNEVWEIACRVAAKLSFGINCISSLCLWYSYKCDAYNLIRNVSYTSATLLAISAGIVGGAMISSLRNNIGSLRLSAALSFVSLLLSIITLVIYGVLMNQAFEMINSAGFYPVPQPNIGYMVAIGGSFLILVSFIAFTSRYRHFIAENESEKDSWYQYQQLRGEYYG